MKIEMRDGKTYIDGKLVEGTEIGPLTITDGRNKTSIGKIQSGGNAFLGSGFDEAMKRMDAEMSAAGAKAEAAKGRDGTGAAVAGVKIEGMRTAGKARIFVDGKPVDLEGGEGVTINQDGSKNLNIRGEGAVIRFGGKKES